MAGVSWSGSTVKETKWTSGCLMVWASSAILAVIVGQGPAQRVKMKLVSQTLPESVSLVNGWLSWSVRENFGTLKKVSSLVLLRWICQRAASAPAAITRRDQRMIVRIFWGRFMVLLNEGRRGWGGGRW